MARNMMDSLLWIREKGLESLCGEMGEFMKGSGKMESNMEKEHLL